MSDLALFVVDTLTVGGDPLAIEDSSVKVEGITKFENEVVSSASGDDYEKRKRVPCMIKGKIQFGPKVDHENLANIKNAQIVLRNSETNRRLRCGKCSLAKLGEIGDGSVDIEFNVLGARQWL